MSGAKHQRDAIEGLSTHKESSKPIPPLFEITPRRLVLDNGQPLHVLGVSAGAYPNVLVVALGNSPRGHNVLSTHGIEDALLGKLEYAVLLREATSAELSRRKAEGHCWHGELKVVELLEFRRSEPKGVVFERTPNVAFYESEQFNYST